MKELTALMFTPEGKRKIRLRIIGRIIFLHKRINDTTQLTMIEQFREKGAKIDEADNWIRIDMFAGNNLVKLGDMEFDVDTKSETEMENILVNFFKLKYKQAHFKVKVKEIE